MIIKLKNNKGFTLTEILIASVVAAILVGGIWSIYFSVVNTYYEEMRGTNVQTEGERILELLTNGGFANNRRIYGLKSFCPVPGYPIIAHNAIPSEWSCFNNTDYNIIFPIDPDEDGVGCQRFAGFYIDFEGAENPTTDLHFRLCCNEEDDPEYDVRISENLLERTNSEDFEDYEETWFKAQLLNGQTGIKISFYLDDFSLHRREIQYNKFLQRQLKTPMNDDEQEKNFLNSIPYPKYFSTTIYFPN